MTETIASPVAPGEQILASVCRFLIDGHQEEIAIALLSCSLTVYEEGWYGNTNEGNIFYTEMELACPRQAYDLFLDSEIGPLPAYYSVKEAIKAMLPHYVRMQDLLIKGELINVDPNWRRELLEIARKGNIDNQAVDAIPVKIWNNLRFRSASEIKIAQALDKVGVLFMPNCKGRLGVPRQNREADFLICHEGKWGILEVDGEPFHPATRTVDDHERDRLFKSHGIRVVEHYDATKCFNTPDDTVRGFLTILSRS